MKVCQDIRSPGWATRCNQQPGRPQWCQHRLDCLYISARYWRSVFTLKQWWIYGNYSAAFCTWTIQLDCGKMWRLSNGVLSPTWCCQSRKAQNLSPTYIFRRLRNLSQTLESKQLLSWLWHSTHKPFWGVCTGGFYSPSIWFRVCLPWGPHTTDALTRKSYKARAFTRFLKWVFEYNFEG